jgi:hypothetical protein
VQAIAIPAAIQKNISLKKAISGRYYLGLCFRFAGGLLEIAGECFEKGQIPGCNLVTRLRCTPANHQGTKVSRD